MIHRICTVCGKEFSTIHHKQVICGAECVKISRLEYQRKYAQKNNENEKERRQRQKIEKEKKVKKQKENRDALVEVNAKARAAGMTYGKYVEMQNAQCNRIIRKVLK